MEWVELTFLIYSTDQYKPGHASSPGYRDWFRDGHIIIQTKEAWEEAGAPEREEHFFFYRTGSVRVNVQSGAATILNQKMLKPPEAMRNLWMETTKKNLKAQTWVWVVWLTLD